MTRFQLLKAIRNLIYARWDSAVDSTWMPRQDGPYKELYVFLVDGRRLHITIEEERWHE